MYSQVQIPLLYQYLLVGTGLLDSVRVSLPVYSEEEDALLNVGHPGNPCDAQLLPTMLVLLC